jgi:hypothetical protein
LRGSRALNHRDGKHSLMHFEAGCLCGNDTVADSQPEDKCRHCDTNGEQHE